MPKTSPLRSRIVSLKKNDGIYEISVRVWEYPDTEISDSSVDFTFRSHAIKALWWKLRLQSAVSPEGEPRRYTNAQYNRALRVATEAMNQDIFADVDERERATFLSQAGRPKDERARGLVPAPTPTPASGATVVSVPSTQKTQGKGKPARKRKSMRKNPNGGHAAIAMSFGSVPDVQLLRGQMTAVTGDETFLFDQMNEEDMQRLEAVAGYGVAISGNRLVTTTAEQLHEILLGLTALWNSGDDRAGDLASSILEVCGFSWD